MNEPTPADSGRDNRGSTGTEDSSLKVSDWVTFLSNEKHGSRSYFASGTALALSAIALAYSTAISWFTWWAVQLNSATPIVAAMIIAIIFACVVFFCLRNWGRRLEKSYKRADEILDGIMMSEELPKPEEIQKRWKRWSCGELTKEHEGKHWQGGAFLASAFWFAGWLFTIAYANLIWWKVIVGIVAWPYLLGVAVR
jgi:hypothetical protein